MASVKWTDEQQAAIDKKGSNILVAAAAGSGKTAVLVERIIKKIIVDRVDIDKILVVTFTNAAASEMRERILEAIYKKIEENPDIVSIGNPGARRGGWLNGAEIIPGKRRQSLQDFAELADVVDCYLVVVSEVCSVHKKLPLCINIICLEKLLH